MEFLAKFGTSINAENFLIELNKFQRGGNLINTMFVLQEQTVFPSLHQSTCIFQVGLLLLYELFGSIAVNSEVMKWMRSL